MVLKRQGPKVLKTDSILAAYSLGQHVAWIAITGT
jgi:hypothetical protein